MDELINSILIKIRDQVLKLIEEDKAIDEKQSEEEIPTEDDSSEQSDNVNSNIKALLVGDWKFKCIQRNIPNLNDSNLQCDKFILADEILQSELKEKLEIDYFALEYTTKDVSSLLIPGKSKKAMTSANCSFMAFDENNKPLMQYGKINCFIERTKNKTEFNLVEGVFPTAEKVEKSYNEKTFLEAVKSKISATPKYTEVEKFGCIDSIINGLYEQLAKLEYNGVKYTDFIIQQYISENKTFIPTMNQCCIAIAFAYHSDLGERAQDNKHIEIKFIPALFQQTLQSNNEAKEAFKNLTDTIKLGIQLSDTRQA